MPITLQPADGFITEAPLTNFSEISNFDNDEDASNGDAADGTLVDTDSTPDAIDGNGAGEIVGEALIDNEMNEDATAGGDEDDHDLVSIDLFDLELVKTLAAHDAAAETVTFDVTVTNQGALDAHLIDVVEYPPAGLSMNALLTTAGLPEGTTFDGATTFTIAGPLAGGDSVTIPVTFDIADATLSPFTNTAEIAAFDNDADDSLSLIHI